MKKYQISIFHLVEQGNLIYLFIFLNAFLVEHKIPGFRPLCFEGSAVYRPVRNKKPGSKEFFSVFRFITG